MKSKLVLLTLAGLAISLPHGSFAAEKMKQPAGETTKPERAAERKTEPAAQSAAPAERALPFQAVVDTVDPATKTFTTKTKAGKVTTFSITDTSTISRDDAVATLADIKPGETVRGTRIKTGEDQWEVVKVMIGAKKDAAPRKPARAKKGTEEEAAQ